MMSRGAITVWLAYVSSPVTTAVYLERALRTVCNVVTVGATLPNEYVDAWQLHTMEMPIIPHDIVTEFKPDMAGVIARRGDYPKPDLFLWVDSVRGFEPLNLEALSCPTVCYLVDSHLFLQGHIQWARQFDYVFIAQREYLKYFQAMSSHAHWLPLACDPGVHCKIDLEKCYDVVFVGECAQGSRREQLLVELSKHVSVSYARCFGDQMARVFSSSKIVFNSAVNHNLNKRFFEALSTGTMLLSDMAVGSGQDELFSDGEEYVCYNRTNMGDLAKLYLQHEILREKIAERGQRIVHNAHTYAHRVADLLDVVFQGKADTFSAVELRERSLKGISDLDVEVHGALELMQPIRSFVIPVLDYSPASQYNIRTLLHDLEQIAGEVVVVFNNSSVGDELKGHPRITRHAIMSQNVGVSRAWNIGISMSMGETVFIVNADAHIALDAVTRLHTAIEELPSACCVGPQGAFVNYALCRDYRYFDKGSFNRPFEVDAVSGFFFAISRGLFREHGIVFDEMYSPCYFEEWDVGLQIRQAGLKNYIVPTVEYDHQWGGTIRSLRTVHYLGKDETAAQILLRNRQIFLSKWRSIARCSKRPQLLESGWKQYLWKNVHELLDAGLISEASLLAEEYHHDFPDEEAFSFPAKFAQIHREKSTASPIDWRCS